MYKTINNVNLNYINYGNKQKDTIVFLHGWGQNIEMMRPIADPFQKDFNIIIVDLPGHGQSSEPTYAWELYDFVSCIHELLESLKIKNPPILVGHSFGGKISLLYASTYAVKKLVLFGSPFRKEIKKPSLKTKVLKKLKTVPGLNKLEEFAKKHMGSVDYRNASPIMREVLVNHVNNDITENVKRIKCPTLIVWGTLDSAVSIDDAYLLESLISDSGVVTYEGCTHYAYLERLGQTINVLRSFF
ncbi:MAG: alpha/beta hydrolase [Tenericutes bacterium]|nr:alpha/beta hydrolase [Mycoplasmatota bacterium]MDD6388346.1 alpha/beta hydrolase [Bacilli bacterium]MDY3800877.1 alpha/beta hydrolase [Bacilli bacterium]